MNYQQNKHHNNMYRHDYDWVYTDVEKQVRRHDLNFIIKQARDVLLTKRVIGLNINSLPKDDGSLYTTVQASELINQLIFDSLYHN